MVSWLHHQGLAFVSCVSPTFFQPVGSGSHLYSAHRNTVRSGHGVEGLTDSRGYFPLGLPCPRLLYPYCITTWEICQEVFEISFKGLFLLGAPLTPGVLWTPLDVSYIVPHIGRFVKGFLEIIFKKVACRKVGSYTASANSSTPSVGFPPPAVFPPLDTNSIPHPSPDCDRQNVQNRDFYFPKLCATFRLTNCWRCVIMEILRASLVGAQPKKPPQEWGGFRISWAVLRP